MTNIVIDLNNPIFQEQLFALSKDERHAALNTLKTIKSLTWEQLYRYKGLKWELITSKQTTAGKNIYSFRFSGKYRCLAYRDGLCMVLLNIFADHDAAYE